MLKRNNNIEAYISFWIVFICVCITNVSCKKYLEVGLPKSRVLSETVFDNDVTATSAVLGIYNDLMNQSGFASGSNVSITAICGLTADELTDFSRFNITNLQFERNEIRPDNNIVLSLWSSMYKMIYQCNAILEGLNTSSGVTNEARNKLLGETYFLRAFSYFYVVNVFGNAPLVTTTNYEVNAVLTRNDVAGIYSQIDQDLQMAIDLLGDNYPTIDDDFFTPARARANKFAALALSARINLYRKNWSKADELASQVINNNNLYEILGNLDNTFLRNSREAIFQIRPRANYTNEAYFFINFSPFYNVMNEGLVNSFEAEDQRPAHWIKTVTPPGATTSVSYAFKYKSPVATEPIQEYSMIIRLAEMYLIRSEARANQDDIARATDDLNEIRVRAGLDPLDSADLTLEEILLLIEEERRHELFTEWGHRWFDLKRTERATPVLNPIKSEWQETDMLFPIPETEFNKNPFLGDQNLGY